MGFVFKMFCSFAYLSNGSSFFDLLQHCRVLVSKLLEITYQPVDPANRAWSEAVCQAVGTRTNQTSQVSKDHWTQICQTLLGIANGNWKDYAAVESDP